METLQKLYRECSSDKCNVTLATRLELEKAVENLLAAEEHIMEVLSQKEIPELRKLMDDIRRLRQELTLTNIPFRVDLEVKPDSIKKLEEAYKKVDEFINLVNKYASMMAQEQISCPTCVPPDTIVSGSYKPIIQISEGDLVLGRDGKHTKVLETLCRPYNGIVVKIHATGVLPIITTPEHPILVVTGISYDGGYHWHKFTTPYWKKAIEINAGRYREDNTTKCDFLVIPIPKGEYITRKINLYKYTTPHGYVVAQRRKKLVEFPLNEETAWLLGVYVAEGSITKDSIIYFSFGKHEKELHEKTMRIIRKLGYKPIKREKETAIVIEFYSRILARTLKEWCGDKAINKRIPEFILYHKDLNIVKAFLRGYFDGDGSLTKSHKDYYTISFSTVSKVLALQLQLLFARFGILVPIFEEYRKEGRIGNRVVRANICYELKTSKDKVFEILDLNVKQKKRKRVYNKGHRVFNDYIIVMVKNVEYLNYRGYVYNLETEDNTYLVNNVIVHNCKEDVGMFLGSSTGEILEKIKTLVKEFQQPFHICCPATHIKLQTLVDLLARKYQVDTPLVVIAKCPIENTNKSCTIFNAKVESPLEWFPSIIFLYEEDLKKYGLRVLFHEFYHHLASRKGLPNTEEEANKFAEEWMKKLEEISKKVKEEKEKKKEEPKTGVGKEVSSPKVEINTSNVKTFNEGDSMFEKLNSVYEPVARYLKVPSTELNRAFTPEVIGTLIQVASDIGLTKLGYTLFNTALGLGLLYGSTNPRAPIFDRSIMVETSAHLITRLVELLKPSNLKELVDNAKELGEALGKFDVNGIVNSLVKSVDEISKEIEKYSEAFFLRLEARPAPKPTPTPTRVEVTPIEVPKGTIETGETTIEASPKKEEVKTSEGKGTLNGIELG